VKRSIETASVSIDAASALVDAALGFARQASFEIGVAVVDQAGILCAFKRSDAAPFLAVDMAINKAWTAASLGYPTHFWNEHVANPKFAPMTNLPRVMAVAGGYPLRDEGRLIGAFGISGGTADQDRDAAEAALTGLGFSITDSVDTRRGWGEA
jgi:uncharacterized protein GlcG (DUF336 family)